MAQRMSFQREIDQAWLSGFRAGRADERARRQLPPIRRYTRQVWRSRAILAFGALLALAGWLSQDAPNVALLAAYAIVGGAYLLVGVVWVRARIEAHRRF